MLEIQDEDFNTNRDNGEPQEKEGASYEDRPPQNQAQRDQYGQFFSLTVNDDLLKGDLETVPTEKPDKKENGNVNSSSMDRNTFDLSAE